MNKNEDINPSFKQESYWSEAWIRHINNYLVAPPRCGFWLESHFLQKYNILEIAGGSCRDSRYLVTKGYEAVGSDFDQKTLEYLDKNHPAQDFKLLKEDAFKFSFKNNEFDVSFSNGFWVLFDDDEDINALVNEQARVTKKYLVSLVHNSENKKLLDAFKKKSLTDNLYNIRFFNKSELLEILKKVNFSYKSISISKFGGPIDKLLSNKIGVKSKALHNLLKKLVPLLYKYQPWSMVERIVIVIELD